MRNWRGLERNPEDNKGRAKGRGVVCGSGKRKWNEWRWKRCWSECYEGKQDENGR